MINEILVPVDGSEHSRKAIEFAVDLSKQFGSKIHLLHIVKQTRVPEGLMDYIKSEGIRETPDSVYFQFVGNHIISAAEDEARNKGSKNTQSVVIAGDPAEEILRYARDQHVDMIVLGSKRLGRVSSKVCNETERTCVIVKRELLDGKRILLVDDEQDVLETLEELLSMCHVMKASSFKEAKELLENQDLDLVVLDIMGVKGYELLEMTKRKKVPAVMLTAHALTPEDTIRSFKEGAASYVPKDRMANIATYLNDVLEAREEGKHSWSRWFERFGSYYTKRFGSKWQEED